MSRGSLLIVAVLMSLLVAAPARAWRDLDGNRIDDRIEAVHWNGWAYAFEDQDPAGRMTIGAFAGPAIQYAVYVGYDHHPTALDEQTLGAAGVPFVKPYVSIDYLRTQATYAQIEAILALPGVTRVEAIPMMYPTNNIGSRVVRARASEGLGRRTNYELFPSVRSDLGYDGAGIVIAILDTGVNDAQQNLVPTYPGHEALLGKFLGGGEFFAGDPNLNTPNDESVNPEDNGPDTWHATHVAATAMGTGGIDGFYAGVAPAARLVDCKVLSDAGVGFGSADGIDWCIANMNNTWGLTGPDTIYAGIDVLNLSLGCLDCSGNGTDANSQAANAAVQAGLVLSISSGNSSLQGGIGTPGAADLVITVGNVEEFDTIGRGDDRVAATSNEGMRTDDGDTDLFDEYKPNVSAPGTAILSAMGAPTSDGGGYHLLSGTSMSAPHVSGVAALLKQADPALTPLRLREILEDTAIHHLPSAKGNRPADPRGIDPNYSPMSGYGMVDAYAAVLEALNSTGGVQVVQIRADARVADGEVDVRWWTQREFPFQGFNIYRAPDVAGVPGAWTPVNGPLVAGVGDPVIDGTLPLGGTNRTPYLLIDGDPALAAGTRFWYRVEWVDLLGTAHAEPAVAVDFGTPVDRGAPPLIASLHYSIRHNTPDHDLTVKYGTSMARNPDGAEFFAQGPYTTSADSVLEVAPPSAATAINGHLLWFWTVNFGVGSVEAYLPPSLARPWFLNVLDDCFVNRMGTIESFGIFVHDAPGSSSGTTYVTNTPTPLPTLETCLNQVTKPTVTAWIPEDLPVPVEFLSLAVEAADGGARVVVDLASEEAGAVVEVRRALSVDFAASEPLVSGQPLVGARYEYLDTEIESGRSYWYWVAVTGRTGRVVLGGPVPIRIEGAPFARTVLAPMSPNPMSAGGVVAYTIGKDAAGEGSVPVRISVHDVAGREVRMLREGPEGPGPHEASWDGRDAAGRPVPAGFYYLSLRAGGVSRSTKVAVLR